MNPRLSPPDQLWVEILAHELYHASPAEIRAALVDKHPPRIIDAVVSEIGARDVASRQRHDPRRRSTTVLVTPTRERKTRR